MLRLEDVHCSYGPVLAVRGVSLGAPAGSLVCILGVNGAGKSTTLKAVAGVVRPRRGRVWLDGDDVTRLSAPARVAAGIAWCPEGRRVFPDFTVEENLSVGGHLLSRRVLAERQARALELFPALAERRRQRAGSLSGGEQQMLALGRALMTAPRLLLLDEPSLGLAPLLVDQLLRTIRTICDAGTTVVLVEQTSRALQVADHAYVLAGGRVEIDAPAAEARKGDWLRRAYLGG